MATLHMELTPKVVETLENEGFIFNKRVHRWVNGRFTIDPRRIVSLRLWEVDQVIVAAKCGRKTVRIGCRGQKLKFA